uniref:Endonuclease/exonuclease/phosphatase domain-containing protein n=1 Tax=Thermomicrobium roseum TaxID=500 RepID=A0A7C1K3P8_THERO
MRNSPTSHAASSCVPVPKPSPRPPTAPGAGRDARRATCGYFRSLGYPAHLATLLSGHLRRHTHRKRMATKPPLLHHPCRSGTLAVTVTHESAERSVTGLTGRTAPKSSGPSFPVAAPDVALWAIVAVALVLVLGLQATRVFVSDLVFVIDQSRRTLLLLLVAVTFASPLLAPLVGALSGGRLLLVATALLVAARTGLQLVDWPPARVALGAIGLAAFGWALLPLLRWRARAGLGILAGTAIDLALRTARDTLDLPWLPGIGSHLVTAILLTLFVVAVGFIATDRGPVEPRGALGLLALGPAFGLLHLVTGNLGFAIVHTGWNLLLASTLLGLGMLLGLLVAPLAAQHWSGWIATTATGTLGLWLAWGTGWQAGVGLALAVTSWAIFTLTAAMGGRLLRSPASVGRAGLALALGQLLQVALLLRYYTATGDRWMPVALWALLALVVALDWPSGWPPGAVALLPHVTLSMLLPLAAAIAWQALSRQASPPALAPRSELVVMTYNIQSGYDRHQRWDLEATARVIETAHPDVVLLQEVSRGWLVTSSADQLTWLAQRLGMHASWGPASADGLWGNAVLTRAQPLEEQVIRFRTTQNLRRGVIAVRLATPTASVWVASTHLDDPRSATAVRLVQIEELLSFLRPARPLILGGDLNAEPESTELAQLQAAGLRDAAAAVGAIMPTSADARRIDYVLITDELEPVAGSVLDVTASDHRPVIIRLVIR